MIQNSGLGNAVSPLTHVFRIPLLLICTHRGAPGVKDEPQHELMGRITGRIFDTMELSWESFPTAPDAIAPVLERAAGHMARGRRPYGLVMQKGTVAPDFEALGLSACAATANKCLHGVPGVSFVVVSRAALSSHSDGPRRSLYLDLRSYCETQGRRSTPLYPIRTGLLCTARDARGAGRRRRMAGPKQHLLGIDRDGLRALGIELLLPREDCSLILKAFQLPHGIGYTELHGRLKDRGFIIYAGQGDLAPALFRVSAMGAIAVYRRTTEGLPVFHTARPPTATELQALLNRMLKRMMNRMHRDVQL
jgi:hypothetical protein